MCSRRPRPGTRTPSRMRRPIFIVRLTIVRGGMSVAHACPLEPPRDPRWKRGYKKGHPKGPAMFLALLLARLNRAPRFVWSPALDFSDHGVYSALIPGAQY